MILALVIVGKNIKNAVANTLKAFDNQWILEDFDAYPSFWTKRMFGGLAVYLFEKLMMLIVEPTQSGKWDWHGVLICTEFEDQPSIMKEFPALKPHAFLKKWLYIDTSHDDFESIIGKVVLRIQKNDPRFGIFPKEPKASKKNLLKKRRKKAKRHQT